MKLERDYNLQIVSRNTLYISFLIDDCMHFLHSLTLDQDTAENVKKIERELDKIAHKETDLKYKREKEILFGDIFGVLEDIAPEGCYFGVHPIDPALLGFWDKTLFSATR